MANDFPVPTDACDCHMHFFGPPDRYPGARERAYSPHPRTPDQYWSVMGPLGFGRVVVVQPSAYHTDNSCVVDAIAGDPSRYRGVAVVPLDAERDELERLHWAGMRGLRFNIVTTGLPPGTTAQSALEDAVRLIRPFGWHLQIFAPARQIAEIAPAIRAADIPIVLDHMGGASADQEIDDPAFRAVLDLVAGGHAWAKLSGADRVMGRDVVGRDDARGIDDFVPASRFARALVRANPDNLVWGSDWPNVTHPVGGRGDDAPRASYRDLDQGVLLRVLREAVNDQAIWRAILVDNAARLYGF